MAASVAASEVVAACVEAVVAVDLSWAFALAASSEVACWSLDKDVTTRTSESESTEVSGSMTTSYYMEPGDLVTFVTVPMGRPLG